MVSPQVRNAIAITITAVWAVGIVADAALQTFELNPAAYGIMLALATAIFGAGLVKGKT